MRKLSFILLFSIISISVWSQDTYTSNNKKAIALYKRSDIFFGNREYYIAIKDLKQALELDSNFLEAIYKLGDIYRVTSQHKEAVPLYTKLIRKKPDFNKHAYFHLGASQFETMDYTAAKQNFEKYLSFEKISPGRIRDTEIYIRNCGFAIEAVKKPVPFEPKNMGPLVNSPYADYHPALSADNQTLIFTRLSPSGEDFYISTRPNDTAKWTLSKSLSSVINTPENEGAQCISQDGQYLFFTLCSRTIGLGSCDIYFAQKEGDKWGQTQNLGEPINTPGWESQPSLSSDGKTLYFASDRRGGIGSYDIWKSNYLGKGAWSVPENLGPSINTLAAEISPFIHPDDRTLYFSSDGYPCMGDKDIFYSRRNSDRSWAKPTNLGYPINTSREERSFMVSRDGEKAYFASEQYDSKGKLDLFYFDLYKEARPASVTYVKGNVFDKISTTKLAANYEVIDLKSGFVQLQGMSNSFNGEFLACLPAGKDYALNVSKDGYLFYSANFSLADSVSKKPYVLSIPLQKIIAGETVVLRNIFFQSKSVKLLDESKVELEKLAAFMKNNPAVRIELSGHTDNTGEKNFNLSLSTNRAKEVYTYLQNAGIDVIKRVQFKGYGQDKPVATNDTEEGRAQNRRTEFKILE